MIRVLRPITTALLALIASATCAGVLAAGASASTGGAASPTAATTPGSTPTSTPATKASKTALATWFGPGFYGQKTACGQTLTPTVVGVANRTLPCGTLVQVSYEGHTLTVPVLDRGPYSHIGADWDLTAGAAQALDITETVRIAASVVGSTPNTPTLGAPLVANEEAATGGAQAG